MRRRGDCNFVVLGSYEPRKGQDILVEAIARLDPGSGEPRAFFQVAGRVLDQTFFEELQARAARLENVELGARARSRGFPQAPGTIRCARLFLAR